VEPDQPVVPSTQPETEKSSVPGVSPARQRLPVLLPRPGPLALGRAATLDEARRTKRQAEADADRGERALRRLRPRLARPFPERTERGFRESSRASYRQTFDKRVIPYFEWRTPPAPHRDPAPRRQGGRAPAHRAARPGVLRALLGDAKNAGVLRDNPAAGVRVIVPEGRGTGREPADEKRAPTLTQVKLLLAALPAGQRLLVELLPTRACLASAAYRRPRARSRRRSAATSASAAEQRVSACTGVTSLPCC